MRTPTLTRKRALGLFATAALTVASTVAFAGSSEAAAASYSLSPKTGPGATAGAVITVTGKDFKSAAGASKVATVDFNSASTCPASPGGSAATTKSVVSATKMVVTAPSLNLGANSAAKAYLLCAYNSGNSALLGSAKYTVYPVPTVSSLSAGAGPVRGGTTVGIDGTNFTRASKVTFGGTAAKSVKYLSATSLSAVVPAHVAEDDVQVQVTTEAGGSADGNGDNFDFLNAVSVSPASGTGTAGDIVTITGLGFKGSAYDFSNPGTTSTVYLGAGAFDDQNAPSTYCSAVQVVSDTELTCTLPSLTDGAYTVLVVADPSDETTASVVSGSATYTASDF